MKRIRTQEMTEAAAIGSGALVQKFGMRLLCASLVMAGLLAVFAGCDNAALDGGQTPASSEDSVLPAAPSASIALAPGSDTFIDTHLDTLGNGYYYEGTFYDEDQNVCHDNYTFDTLEGNYLIYDMTSDTPYSGRIVSGEIVYIHHFGNNVPITITEINNTTHNFDGAAGVLIVELDHGIDDSEWLYTGSGDFTAVYYYDGKPIPNDDDDEDEILTSVQNGGALNNGILTSVQNGENPEDYVLTSVQLGFAAAPNPDLDSPIKYGTPCFEDLDDAIDAFDSIASLQTYIKEPAEYVRTPY
jgi:hypothetical protein